jgi:prepilin-type N-terminal cleavage/methylation domain-containing protein
MQRETQRRSKRQGYTLIDMMAVIAIVGVLAAVGINQYGKNVARSKRPEVTVNLQAIAKAQRAHRLTWGKYAGTFDALGFSISGGHKVSPTEIQAEYYNYRISQPDGVQTWYVVAAGNIDGDPFNDIITARNQ